MLMNKLVAITIGDIKGIGIQILIDCWKKNRIKNFILFSDIKIINKYFIKVMYALSGGEGEK